jgi:hypothetical protein
MAALPVDNPDVRLVVERQHKMESIAGLVDLVELLDGLVVPCAWLSLVARQPPARPKDSARFRQAVRAQADDPKAPTRFFPSFGPQLRSSIPQITLGQRDPADSPSFLVDPADPLDFGVQVGLNAWLRSTVRQELPREAYDRIFSFAAVDRIRHESPLVIETVIVTGGLAGAALYRILKAVYRMRAHRAETLRTEAEAAVAQGSKESHIESERQKSL